MRKTRSIIRTVVFAALALGLTAAQVSYAQTDATASSPSDLAARIDALQKQLADLKSQMEEQQAQTIASAAPVPEPVQAAAATPAAPAPPSLAGLLGPTTLSGFVDVYYGYNSNQPAGRTNAFRSFDTTSSQFALNMIELVGDKPVDMTNRVGYHVALGFGQAENAVNGGELGFDQVLKEGYLEYMAPVGKGLQFNFGKFVTPAGAEVIESKDNWNYTRGILFSWAIPYFHFGMSAKYAFNSKVALTAYLVNGWNNSIDNNSGKTTGFSFGWTPNSKFSLTQNYLVGPEQTNDNSDFRHLLDTVATYSPNAKLSLMANYDYGRDHVGGTTLSPYWTGIAGYVKYAANDKWTLAARGEYFNDNSGFATGTALSPTHLSEFTGTLQRMLAGKIISRLEYRYDKSNQDVFPYRTSGLPGSPFAPVDHQNTVTIGLVYAFSSADAK
jgi:Putative beta-barrel porin-2, OmpL-like. bbp2